MKRRNTTNRLGTSACHKTVKQHILHMIIMLQIPKACRTHKRFTSSSRRSPQTTRLDTLPTSAFMSDARFSHESATCPRPAVLGGGHVAMGVAVAAGLYAGAAEGAPWCASSHSSAQAKWKRCPQGRCARTSPVRKSSRHTAHSSCSAASHCGRPHRISRRIMSFFE
jgi:hypothetical protein